MFPGMMMDPELMRMAQEQMSRMSPADLTRMQQQMMSNPELMKMASESMMNLRPEALKQAAEQLKHTRPEDVVHIGEKVAKASPEELAAMHAQIDAHVSYEVNAAEMLKKQGNELHSRGKYSDALQKYMHAKKNLKDVPTTEGKNLQLACSLNMMSCYLKTGQFEQCTREGTEVLAYDAKNVKALYRRGQAYKEMGKLRSAISDWSEAHEVSPEDDTIADILRDAKERLIKEGTERASRESIVEEITEEATVSFDGPGSSTAIDTELLSQDYSRCSASRTENLKDFPSRNSESVWAVKDDSESASDVGGSTSSQCHLSGNDLQKSLLSSNADLQEQMRNQMKDPAMRQIFTSMIKNVSPEMMANMSQQFGLKLTGEDALKAHQAMSSMSPEALDMMMTWADRCQRGVEGARRTKNWLLGRPGMILTILVLLLAFILHWFGFFRK